MTLIEMGLDGPSKTIIVEPTEQPAVAPDPIPAEAPAEPEPAPAYQVDQYGYEVREERVSSRHPAPAVGCDCGIYALHAPTFWYGTDRARPGLSFGQLAAVWGLTPEEVHVAGLVVGWGRVEVHTDGFRAEFARVAAIAVPDGPDRRRDAALARAIAAEYQVPAVPQDDLERVAPEFGAPVPPEHRPARQPARLPATSIVAAARSMHGLAFSSTSAAVAAGALGYSFAFGSPPPLTIRPRAAASSPPAPVDPAKPGDVIKALSARPKYDHRQFLPKRKGGLR